jgi:hypothetical protein
MELLFTADSGRGVATRSWSTTVPPRAISPKPSPARSAGTGNRPRFCDGWAAVPRRCGSAVPVSSTVTSMSLASGSATTPSVIESRRRDGDLAGYLVVRRGRASAVGTSFAGGRRDRGGPTPTSFSMIRPCRGSISS